MDDTQKTPQKLENKETVQLDMKEKTEPLKVGIDIYNEEKDTTSPIYKNSMLEVVTASGNIMTIAEKKTNSDSSLYHSSSSSNDSKNSSVNNVENKSNASNANNSGTVSNNDKTNKVDSSTAVNNKTQVKIQKEANSSKDSRIEKLDKPEPNISNNVQTKLSTKSSDSSKNNAENIVEVDTDNTRSKSPIESGSSKIDNIHNESGSSFDTAHSNPTGILMNGGNTITENSTGNSRPKTSFKLDKNTTSINDKPSASKSMRKKSLTRSNSKGKKPLASSSTEPPPLRSLMDISFDFGDTPDPLLKTVKQEQKNIFQSLDELPVQLQYATLQEFEQSFGISQENPLVPKNAAGSTHKWPTPESIDQVRQLCDTELSEGTPQSQLALCLHLMESAYIADPDNNRVLPPDDTKQGSGLFEDVLARFKQVTAPTTLGEALVFESKKLLKQLANGGHVAGEGGDGEAQYILGSCYGMGALGWPINHKRAFQWYLQASKNDHAEATFRTGVCYELGIGTEENGASAVQFYEKAAVNMHVPSMYKLGIILMRGLCGYAVNKKEAVVWLTRAANRSFKPILDGDYWNSTTTGSKGGIALPQALHALGVVYMNKECEETSLIYDPKHALSLFRDSARFGYAPAQYKLGEYYERNDRIENNEEESIRWYSLAAKQNFPEACLRLSEWYLSGSLNSGVLKQDDLQAFLWAKKAAGLAKSIQSDKLSADIYYVLAHYYEKGVGTEVSKEKAKYYYQKAAKHFHPIAMKKKFD